MVTEEQEKFASLCDEFMQQAKETGQIEEDESDIYVEESEPLIDPSIAKMSEDWSFLCHQVVGFESD